MEEIKQFIIENWRLILSFILMIVSLIVALVRNKKNGGTFLDTVIGLVFEQIPQWIIKAESTGNTGEQKKVQVINEALNYASKTLGRKLTEEETSFMVSQSSILIEKILQTPQTKEASNMEGKKNAKYR